MAVTSGAKGGRYCESPIITYVDAILNRMKEAGNDKVATVKMDASLTSVRKEDEERQQIAAPSYVVIS